MTFGARLRVLRLQRGLTLGDVAGDEVSVALVSKLERDLVNPSLQTLQYLAAQLGLGAADLLSDHGEHTGRRAIGILDAARARLLLGDPAEAAALALGAVAQLTEPEPAETGPAAHRAGLDARLLAVAAEAALAMGDAGRALTLVRDASALIAPAGSRDDPAARTEIARVLGALERRRGALADAERTWTRCLASLEERRMADAPSPWWDFLRASVLAELGGLAEGQGDAERARNLVARAASIAAGVAQAVGPAGALLAAWTTDIGEHVPPGLREEAPAAPHAALALAVVAAADRLGRRLTQEAARLERAAWTPGARAPDLAVTRGLR